MYKLKQKDKKNIVTFNSDDALYEVNRKLKEDNNETLDFTHFSHVYSVDYSKQDISIDGTSQALKLPKNSEDARWINFRRNGVEIVNGRMFKKQPIYFIGFQVTIDGVNHKRMVKITDDLFELVDKS